MKFGIIVRVIAEAWLCYIVFFNAHLSVAVAIAALTISVEIDSFLQGEIIKALRQIVIRLESGEETDGHHEQ